MPLFGSKSFVGLDVGSHTIKVVELAPVDHRFRVLHAGTAPTPPGAVKEGVVIDPHSVANRIRQALTTAGTKGGRVVSAIGGQAVIVRELKFPPMPDADLQNAARFEAERYVPYGVRDVNMDLDVIGETTEDGQKKVVVLLVAAKRDTIDKHVQALEVAGLEPFVLDVDAFAIMRAHTPHNQPAGDAQVFVDMGAETTDIVIAESGQMRLTRNVNIGGNNLTRAVATKLELEFTAAEHLKEQKGMILLEGEPMPDDKTVLALHDLMLPIIGDLATEVRRSLDYFQTRYREAKISRIAISGGTARLPNLARFLSLELGVETVVGDPFAQCEVGAQVLSPEARRQDAPVMATAVGLAMRGAAER